jgi:hypothetical protein
VAADFGAFTAAAGFFFLLLSEAESPLDDFSFFSAGLVLGEAAAFAFSFFVAAADFGV